MVYYKFIILLYSFNYSFNYICCNNNILLSIKSLFVK